MKNLYFLIIALTFLSCKSANVDNSNSDCTENSQFKEKFFFNLNYIEKNITEVQDEKFKNSLEFLSKYVYISFDEFGSYSNTYPIGIFEKDKKGWLKWYEENKCNNLKLKDTNLD